MKTSNRMIFVLCVAAITFTLPACANSSQIPKETNSNTSINESLPPFIPLWPDGKMPNSKGLEIEDVLENQRYQQVAVPGFWALFPSKDDNSGCAVLIIPGGGYHHETFNLAGLQFGKWLNTLGISAFVLKYRLPHSPDLQVRQLGPLQDAQRAMQIIRANADEWKIDKNKIGVMGSSAGGHLAALLGTTFEDTTTLNDTISNEIFLPDFMILISPVITMGPNTHKGSRDNLLGPNPSDELIEEYSAQNRVTKNTPPAFVAHAANDNSVPPINSLVFVQAMLKHEVPVTFHLFPSGGHGIGLSNNPPCADLWMQLCELWLREQGFIK